MDMGNPAYWRLDMEITEDEAAFLAHLIALGAPHDLDAERVIESYRTVQAHPLTVEPAEMLELYHPPKAV